MIRRFEQRFRLPLALEFFLDLPEQSQRHGENLPALDRFRQSLLDHAKLQLLGPQTAIVGQRFQFAAQAATLFEQFVQMIARGTRLLGCSLR